MDRERYRLSSRPASRVAKQTVRPNRQPTLLDDDDDIFALWQSQKQIQIQRLAEEAAKRELKRARKRLAKEERLHNDSMTTAGREIAISLSLPQFSLPSRTQLAQAPAVQWLSAHRKIIAMTSASIIVIVAISWAPRLLIRRGASKTNGGTGTAVAAKPDFQTVAPASGTAVAPKFDSERKVVSFSDILAGTPVVVSEQPMPAGFKTDTAGSLTNLAKQINANDKLPSDTLAFAGLSAKGPQTVLFVKNELLIFIVADKKIDSKSWASYIDKLQ